MRALKITNSITRRDEKSLDKYLADISKYEVLTPDEEVEIFKRIRNGDDAALIKILLHNLRFVVSVAKQYQHTGLWLGDLISEGNIGLIKAARKFDETRGFKFISYAVWWIRQSIIEAITTKSRKIRLPANHQSATKKVIEARNEYLQKNEWEPSVKELANSTGIREQIIQKCLETYKKCRSLDAPVLNGEDVSLVQLIEDTNVDKPDHKVIKTESQKRKVKQLLTKLPPKEAKVVSLFYGIERMFPMTLSDIGQKNWCFKRTCKANKG